MAVLSSHKNILFFVKCSLNELFNVNTKYMPISFSTLYELNRDCNNN